MSNSYKELIQHLNPPLGAFRKESAEVMTGFDAMSKAAMTAGAISALDKELIATAIAVSTRCAGCIAYHVRALVRLGATREQVNEMLSVAVYMGGGPSLMYAGEVLFAFDEFSAKA
jgi:AhpD family alkylhydroperoxidase